MICESCGNDERTLVIHHESYQPQRTILVCRPCHAKIHKEKREQRLRYNKKEGKFIIETPVTGINTLYLTETHRMMLDIRAGDVLEWHITGQRVEVRKKVNP